MARYRPEGGDTTGTVKVHRFAPVLTVPEITPSTYVAVRLPPKASASRISPSTAVPRSHASVRLPSHRYATARPSRIEMARVAPAPATRPAYVAGGTATETGTDDALGVTKVPMPCRVAGSGTAGGASFEVAKTLSVASTAASVTPPSNVR